MIQSFRDLDFYCDSYQLALEVHEITLGFPSFEKLEQGSQMRRASKRIPANIAEGCGKSSIKETVRFLQIAAGSVTETENHLLLATEVGYIHPGTSDALVEQTAAIRRMLYRLSKHLAERAPHSGG